MLKFKPLFNSLIRKRKNENTILNRQQIRLHRVGVFRVFFFSQTVGIFSFLDKQKLIEFQPLSFIKKKSAAIDSFISLFDFC